MQNIYPTARSARPGVPKTPSGAYHTDYWERIPHTELRQGAFPLVKGRKRMEISGREFCNKPNPLFLFGSMAGGGIVLKISMRQPEKIALCRESRLPRQLPFPQAARLGQALRGGDFRNQIRGRGYRKDAVPAGIGERHRFLPAGMAEVAGGCFFVRLMAEEEKVVFWGRGRGGATRSPVKSERKNALVRQLFVLSHNLTAGWDIVAGSINGKRGNPLRSSPSIKPSSGPQLRSCR